MEKNLIRALCIDDNIADIDLIKEILKEVKNFKFSLNSANTIARGINALKNASYDVILLDLTLPDSSAIESFTAIHDCAPDTPIIILSGLSNEQIAQECVKLGAQDYFVKGDYTGVMLVKAIIYGIERKKSQLEVSREKYFLSDVFTSISDGISVVDNDSNIVKTNKTMEEWFRGMMPLVGKKCYLVYHNKKRKCHQCRLDNPSGDNGYGSCVVPKIGPKGKHEGWLELHAFPLVDRNTGRRTGLIEYVRNITKRKNAEDKLHKINQCFLAFKTDPRENINLLVKTCHELLESAVALYTRLDNDILSTFSSWESPNDFNVIGPHEGRICYDNIRRGKGLKVLRNLSRSNYAKTDPNILKYDFQTYIGLPIKFGSNCIGSLCVLFKQDIEPDETAKKFMELIASAIRVEEGRLRAEEGLKASQIRYQSMFENSPISLWEEDFSGVKLLLDDLRAAGVTNFRKHFTENPELIGKCVSLIKIMDVNKSTLTLFGAKSKREFCQGLTSVFTEESYEAALEEIIAVSEGRQSFECESLNQTFKGQVRNIRLKWSVLPGHEENYSKILVSLIDITANKKSEEALMKSEEKFKNLAENSPNMIFINYKGQIIYVNQKCVDVLGYSKKRFYSPGFDFMKLIASESRSEVRSNFEKRLEGEDVQPSQYTLLAKDGKKIHTITSTKLIDCEYGIGILGIITDITDYESAQREINKERDRATKYLDLVGNIVLTLDKKGFITMINKRGAEILGYEQTLIIGKNWFDDFIPKESKKETKKIFKEVMKGNVRVSEYTESTIMTKSAQEKVISWHNSVLLDEKNKPIGYLSAGSDITARINSEKEKESLYLDLARTNKRLRQLVLRDPHTGLYNHKYLAEAIDSEFLRSRRYSDNLSVMLIDINYFKSINDLYGHKYGDMVIKQFAKLLKKMVRSYDIVIRSGGEEFIVICPGTDRQLAVSIAERMESTINLFEFGNSRQSVKISVCIAISTYPHDAVYKGMDLINLANKIIDKSKSDGQERVSTSEVLTKKQLKKIRAKKKSIQVRSLESRLSKLNKISKQSVAQSIFAFARTIELKDHYTGEHVERTVSFATEIARKMGLSKENIELIKQASILHDLGKVGISDRILLKKAKLNTKEFAEIMRHPQIGADILRPIQFMHDIIPLIFYHHEKWNGTGYPSGLKGEEIPIGARIIALADGFQALASDRPYRKAFSNKEVQEIIKSESGKKYDPKLVKMFLKMIDQKPKRKAKKKRR